MSPLYVQYGCGFCAPEEWANFDASLTLRLERTTIIGRFVRKNAQRFPANVRYGDIVKGLPVADGVASGVYASHVLEHLARDELAAALVNTLRIMAPGGIFRLVVPDLERRALDYLDATRSGHASANDVFMRSSGLGFEMRPSARFLLGRSAHLWMWDYPSLAGALTEAGFSDIRHAAFGDSGDPMFLLVEDKGRFLADGLPELAIQCRRP